MSQSPRILVVGADSGPADDIAGTLRKRGVESRFAAGADSLKASIDDARPDIVIVDGRAAPADISAILGAAKGNGTAGTLPIIFINGTAELAADTLGHLDNVLPNDFREVELLSRLDSLTRLNTMQDELVRRHETDRLYGVHADDGADTAVDTRALRLVAVSANDETAAAIKSLLDDTARFVVCGQGHEALAALNDERYDCVIVDGTDARLDGYRLCEEIRSNPRLFHLPVIVIAGDAADAVDAYYAHGASDVVTGDWQNDDFTNRIRTHARHQRTRSKMLQVYGKAMHLVTSDSLTGLYSHGYLHAHLANQIKAAEHKGRDLSVGFFHITELQDINETFGYAAGDKVLRQIGTILSCIVRGEDLPARYSGNEFCIVFPDTPADTAERIVQRIKSVIESTELAIPEINRAVTVLTECASASLSPGRDTAKDLIGRARKAVKR